MDGIELKLSPEKLQRYVQEMLETDKLQLGDWTCSRLGWKASNAVTGGLYRAAGTARLYGWEVTWSLIVKVIVPVTETDDPGHYSYWKREALAYRSGALEQLPDMVRAPRCFAVEEQADGSVWLWLEDVPFSAAPPWTLIRYQQAARLLGRFNGAYLNGWPLPDEPWLCTGWLASWVEACDRYDNGAALTEENWRSPLLRQLLPSGMFRRYEAFHQARPLLLQGLQSLPRVLTHNDAWPPNLLLTDDGGMVVIDWAFVGIAGVGEELGRLYGLMLHSDPSLAEARHDRLPEQLFESYLAGLRLSGREGNRDQARFGFMAAAGLRCGMVVAKLMDDIGANSTHEAAAAQEAAATSKAKAQARCGIALRLLRMAEEAESLLPVICRKSGVPDF
ncbi:phosphotransferase [Paenibacillus piri]|uniref:Aminoglycoside phosphotransferase family protein n=1 Tax=Paenibacillus piri TaxID=2547395 RepID=A0A4R5KL20_9BACL|nr:phosphotransferase [Paenibacillus piri]TDF96271.1 aminoglycoside phosphotransferase family protein [Paenibacillus piri]